MIEKLVRTKTRAAGTKRTRKKLGRDKGRTTTRGGPARKRDRRNLYPENPPGGYEKSAGTEKSERNITKKNRGNGCGTLSRKTHRRRKRDHQILRRMAGALGLDAEGEGRLT